MYIYYKTYMYTPYTHMDIHIHVYMRIDIRMYTYVCAYIHMHMLYAHAHTHVCSRATQRCQLSWVPLRNTFHALPFQNPGAGLPSCSGGQGSLLCWKWSVGGQEGGDKGRSQWELPPSL